MYVHTILFYSPVGCEAIVCCSNPSTVVVLLVVLTKILQKYPSLNICMHVNKLLSTVNHEPRQWFIIGIDQKFDNSAKKIILINYLTAFKFQLKNLSECPLVLLKLFGQLLKPQTIVFKFFGTFGILENLHCIIILVWRGYGNIEQQCICKTIDKSLKYQYPVQWAFKSTIFYVVTRYRY